MIVLGSLSLSACLLLIDAGSVVATEVIPAGERVTLENTRITEEDLNPEESHVLLGRDARRTIYIGQNITEDNTRPHVLINRNQIVTVRFVTEGLEISTLGRAMEAAGELEAVSVLNLDTRKPIQGIVQQEGWVLVQ